MSDFWTSNDAKQLMELLKKVKQPWSHEFFETINSLIPVGGWEAIFLRGDNNGGVEVLLVNRADDDNNWPGQPAIPGSIPRATDIEDRTSDEINEIVLNRIFSKELRLSEEIILDIEITNCGVVTWRHDRGGSISNCFICITDPNDLFVGTWYPVDNLPKNLLGGQHVVVEKAVEYINNHGDDFDELLQIVY